ncbi:hypothetical protein IOD13_17585 [Brevibacterium casei]|nr:hypothetical protein [Brevibacterium casei]
MLASPPRRPTAIAPPSDLEWGHRPAPRRSPCPSTSTTSTAKASSPLSSRTRA